jgi:Spy/CpxP family protein refolding chaperone
MVPHAKSAGIFGLISMPRVVAALATACIFGGTAIAQTPVLAAAATRATCDAVDGDVLDLGAVMQVITQCQDDLALSDAQRERLDTVTVGFIESTIRSEARRDLLEGALALLLRPDAGDPGAPVDIVAAEAKIRELERIAADQDIAALRAVEASKAVLTAEQRAKLAELLAARRSPAAAKLLL